MLSKQEVVRNFILNTEKERVHQRLTQAQMAKKLEMSLSGYKKMISGVTAKIDLYTAQLLHYMTGKGIVELVDDQEEDIELLQQLRKLSPQQRRFIKGIIQFEIEFSPSSKEAEKEYLTVFVPTGNMEDGMIFDSAHYYKINASSYRKKFGDDLYCGIQITSEHLCPVYFPGDILLICRRAIRDGDTGIFLNKETGRAYIRKLKASTRWTLEPINGSGKPIVLDTASEEDMTNWIRFGYVLSKIRE